MGTAIIALGALYFVGHLLTHVFEKVKIPDVLILILFGILIGPVLGLVHTDHIGTAGQLFTSIALIIILFEGGLDLEITHVWRSAQQAIKLTVAFFFVTAAVIFGVMHYGYGYSPMASIVLGFICGGTSSAVVIPMVSAMRVGSEARAILILESALTDVLCIVFTLGVLQSFQNGAFEIGKIIGNLLSSFILASVIGIAGGVFWTNIINRVRMVPNTQFATFAFMFIVYGIAESLEYSGAIASLAFGILLGNNKMLARSLSRFRTTVHLSTTIIVTDAERKLYKEIVFLIKIFFFIYLGISIPFEHVYVVLIALSIVMGIYIVRPFATRALVTRHVTAYDRSVIAVMTPKGLAAAVLAGLPTQYGMIEGNDIQAITYDIVLISILFTSVLIPLLERTPYGRLMQSVLGASPDMQTKNEAATKR